MSDINTMLVWIPRFSAEGQKGLCSTIANPTQAKYPSCYEEQATSILCSELDSPDKYDYPQCYDIDYTKFDDVVNNCIDEWGYGTDDIDGCNDIRNAKQLDEFVGDIGDLAWILEMYEGATGDTVVNFNPSNIAEEIVTSVFVASNEAILNYNGGTQALPGAFNITFVDKEISAHDAFDFGGALSGFWIGKFENSSDTICIAGENSAVGYGCNLTTIRPKIIPGVYSWRGAMVSTFFYDILAMTEEGNQYGFDKTKDTTLDTHMLKNNEWGAVAYLTQSIYGRCSSSTSCTEIGINNKYGYFTGYGAPSGSSSSVTNGISSVTTGTYETALGMDASTTGNIYGVYDMSGGAYEYVMGVYWDGTKYWSGYSTTNNQHSGFNGWLGNDNINYEGGVPYPSDNKYYNLYTTESAYTSAGLQHGMTETSRWYGDYAYFVNSNSPWFHRGGFYNNSSNAGVFSFYDSDYSGGSYPYYGSRVSAIIN